MRKAILLSVLLIVLLLAASVWGWFYIRSTQWTHEVIWGNGRIEADQTLPGSKVVGRVLSVSFDEGSPVQTGQILAVLDSSIIKAQIQGAKSQVIQLERTAAAAQSDVDAANSQRAFANEDFQRYDALLQNHAVSIQTRDQYRLIRQTSEARYSQALARYYATGAQLDSTKARLEELLKGLEDYHIVSPLTGVVLYKLVEPGEVVTPGGRVASLIDPNMLYMTLYVPEKQAGRIHLGDPARIRLDAFPNQWFPAYVMFISEQAEFTPKEVQTTEEREKLVFRVKLRVKQPPSSILKPGMPGEGFIKVDVKKPWPDLPNSS